MRMTGVRPGTLTTSRVAPGREDSFARAQRSNSATASSIYPWAAQSGSKAGDLFGILMYSTKVGTISSDQHALTNFVVLAISSIDYSTFSSSAATGSRPHSPLTACRVAVPLRGGPRSVSSVRLTVSPANCPVILWPCAGSSREAPIRLQLQIPRRNPGLPEPDDTDKWPCLLVSLTTQSPQRVPGMAGPSTLQTPSASCGAAAVGSTARTGETTNDEHMATARKLNAVRPFRCITRLFNPDPPAA